MFQKRMLWSTGLGLALLAPSGCYDFDKALEECELSGRCQPAEDGPCRPNSVDLPDDSFRDSNCDGVDGTASAALFVDPLDGRDIHPGTRDAPLQTLSRALQVAKDRGLSALYLARGTYDEPEFELDVPVSLYGGYAGVAGGWARGNQHMTQVGGGNIGLTLRGLGQESGVVIERVQITSTPGTNAGAPSIGMRVLQSGGVRLRYVEIQAGAGASGVTGTSPESPQQSGDSGFPGESQVEASNLPPALGGAPGPLSCGDDAYPGAKGGNGGTQSTDATAGEPSSSVSGGAAASFRNTSASTLCPGGSDPCHCQGDSGEKGQDGTPGAPGMDGAAGLGLGSLEPSSGTWQPAVGQAGGTGHRGGGGGGGGGGGICNLDGITSEAGGGGGGGAGGCPGVGASGGGGGGASIALLLMGGRVELESVILKTAGGGTGGAGGTGSSGSPGGQGGGGGTSYTRTDSSFTPVRKTTGGSGGPGGNGGAGGRGGHGGNGAGGPSVGIWCDSDSTSSALEQGSVSYSLGEPGAPGSGPGLKDETVHKYKRYQCPPAT